MKLANETEKIYCCKEPPEPKKGSGIEGNEISTKVIEQKWQKE